MTKELICKQVKKLQLSEQIDIAIDILLHALKFTGNNEKLLIDELNQIKKIIVNPSNFALEDSNE